MNLHSFCVAVSFYRNDGVTTKTSATPPRPPPPPFRVWWQGLVSLGRACCSPGPAAAAAGLLALLLLAAAATLALLLPWPCGWACCRSADSPARSDRASGAAPPATLTGVASPDPAAAATLLLPCGYPPGPAAGLVAAAADPLTLRPPWPCWLLPSPPLDELSWLCGHARRG